VQVYGFDQSTLIYRQLGQSAIYGESEYDGFGSTVSLSADGKTLAAAAYGPMGGSYVQVYKWEEATYEYLPLGDKLGDPLVYEEFGWSLSLSDSGKTLAVGSRLSGTYGLAAGKVEVYGWDEAALKYNQLGESLVTEEEYDYFGRSISLSADGETLAVGAPSLSYSVGNSTGFVNIYVWDEAALNYKHLDAAVNEDAPSDNWWEEAFSGSQRQTLVGDDVADYFGYSVSLAADGKSLAVGAPQSTSEGSSNDMKKGYVKVYEWNEDSMSYEQVHIINGEAAGDRFGTYVSLSADGQTLVEAGGNMLYGDVPRNKVNVFNLE
jgi:6-phosphogluconolactonase (cycloisomerase 2 family)